MKFLDNYSKKKYGSISPTEKLVNKHKISTSLKQIPNNETKKKKKHFANIEEGSCFPKDVSIIMISNESSINNYDMINSTKES